MMGRIFGVDHTLVYRWVRAFGESLPEPEVSGDIREIEFDEMWHFVRSKKTNFGSSKPLIVAQGELWVLGGRNTATFRRLYNKMKHLKYCIFYTDDWDAFSKVLPPERHVIGKAHTIDIEHDNSDTRHHLRAISQ